MAAAQQNPGQAKQAKGRGIDPGGGVVIQKQGGEKEQHRRRRQKGPEALAQAADKTADKAAGGHKNQKGQKRPQSSHGKGEEVVQQNQSQQIRPEREKTVFHGASRGEFLALLYPGQGGRGKAFWREEFVCGVKEKKNREGGAKDAEETDCGKKRGGSLV